MSTMFLAGLGGLLAAVFMAAAFIAGWEMAHAERDARIGPDKETEL